MCFQGDLVGPEHFCHFVTSVFVVVPFEWPIYQEYDGSMKKHLPESQSMLLSWSINQQIIFPIIYLVNLLVQCQNNGENSLVY